MLPLVDQPPSTTTIEDFVLQIKCRQFEFPEHDPVAAKFKDVQFGLVGLVVGAVLYVGLAVGLYEGMNVGAKEGNVKYSDPWAKALVLKLCDMS